MEHDPLERNLGFLIHDIARLMRTEFDQSMKPLGLTRSQWWVLVYLFRKDGLTQRELGDVLDIGKVTLSGLIRRLEEKGWVERRSDSVDRRIKRVFLTVQASKITRKIVEDGIELIQGITQEMSRDERHQLADLLIGVKIKLLDKERKPTLVEVLNPEDIPSQLKA